MKTTLLSLKAFFTICLLCLVGGVNVMAQTDSYSFATKPSTFPNATGKNTALTFTNAKFDTNRITCSAKGSLNITVTTPGKIIESIEFISPSTKYMIKAETTSINSEGTISITSTSSGSCTAKWTSSSDDCTDLVLTAVSEIRIKSLKITLKDGKLSITSPTITPTTQEFHKPFTATISSVEGATIYYTIDGSDPRTSTTRSEYTTGVEIPAATTTLKACAVKGEATSTVSSATYTFFPIYENIAALKTVAVNGEKYYVDFKNAVVTYTFNNNAFVEDNSGAAIHVYQNHSLKAGNLLNGTTSVVYSVYLGDNQIKDIDFTKLTITEGADIPVTEVDIKTLNANIEQYESKRIRVKKALVTIEGAFDTKKQATLTQGENSIVLYKKGTANMNDVVKNDAIIDVIGYPLVYKNSGKTTNELTIWAGDDAVASTDNFTITTAQYGTYYTEDAFVMPEGVTGYTITSEDGKTLKFNETYAAGAVVPAKTALLLKATEKLTADKVYTYTIVNSTEVAPTDNLLHGSVAEATTSVEGAKAYYKLANDEVDHLGFYYGAENGGEFKNGAHKAYLAVMTENLSQKRGFSFDSMTTGINHVVANAEHAKSTVIYDLNGRRVNSLNAAAKGVYIVNGKKVIVK